MSDVLAKINAYKREEIARAKAIRPLAALKAEAQRQGPTRGFMSAISGRVASGTRPRVRLTLGFTFCCRAHPTDFAHVVPPARVPGRRA